MVKILAVCAWCKQRPTLHRAYPNRCTQKDLMGATVNVVEDAKFRESYSDVCDRNAKSTNKAVLTVIIRYKVGLGVIVLG